MRIRNALGHTYEQTFQDSAAWGVTVQHCMGMAPSVRQYVHQQPHLHAHAVCAHDKKIWGGWAERWGVGIAHSCMRVHVLTADKAPPSPARMREKSGFQKCMDGTARKCVGQSSRTAQSASAAAAMPMRMAPCAGIREADDKKARGQGVTCKSSGL